MGDVFRGFNASRSLCSLLCTAEQRSCHGSSSCIHGEGRKLAPPNNKCPPPSGDLPLNRGSEQSSIPAPNRIRRDGQIGNTQAVHPSSERW
ncbi:hypothetical protein AOLI_G00156530 [Acnodon oligacanthus]